MSVSEAGLAHGVEVLKPGFWQRLRDSGRRLRNVFGAEDGAGRYVAMEGLRAYAALLIFAVHFANYFSGTFLSVNLDAIATESDLERHERYVSVMYYFFRSHYGVDLFFLLSGFLICRLALRQDFRYGGFLRNRFRRIYPAYIVGLLAVLTWTWFGHGERDFTSLDALANLLLLNSFPQLGLRTLYTVNWSLGFEFLFYLLFPLVLLLRRGGPLKPLHVVAGALLVYLVALGTGSIYVRFLMFFGGVMLALYRDEQLREMARAVPDWLVLVAYLGATTMFLYYQDFRTFIPVFLPAATLLVLNSMFGTGFLNAFFSLRIMRFLGNISFSFYLLHATVIDIVFYSYKQTSMPWRRDDCLVLGLVVCLGASIILASLVYGLVERRYFRRRHAMTQVVQTV